MALAQATAQGSGRVTRVLRAMPLHVVERLSDDVLHAIIQAAAQSAESADASGALSPETAERLTEGDLAALSLSAAQEAVTAAQAHDGGR